MTRSLSRRDFGPALLASAGGAGVVATVRGDDRPVAAQPPAAAPADLLLAALIQLHPSEHFTPERLAGIRAGLQRNLELSRTLWSVPLANGDGPATVFRAQVARPAGAG